MYETCFVTEVARNFANYREFARVPGLAVESWASEW